MISTVKGGTVFRVTGSCLAVVAVLRFVRPPGIFQHGLVLGFSVSVIYIH